LRPAFGFFPWFALFRRDFSLRFEVFLLIGPARLADADHPTSFMSDELEATGVGR
jgi:hypothetical protein